MWYVYRDCSVAGWAALAAFLLFAAGFSCGRHRCTGWRAWWSLVVMAAVVAAAVFGSRYYLTATNDFALDQFYPAARIARYVAVALFLCGLSRGWVITKRGPIDSNFSRPQHTTDAPTYP